MSRSYRSSSRTSLVAAALSLVMAGCFGSADGMEALTAADNEETETSSSEGSSSSTTPAAGPAEKAPELSGPPAAPESPVQRFVGSYRYVGGVEEQRKLWGKIEGMAGTFNFIARGIVRDRLAAGNQIAKEIRIEADQDTLAIHTGKASNAGPIDGSTIEHKSSDGTKMDMSYAIDERIVQTFKGRGNGRSRINTYALDGDKLTVTTKITAPQLPYPLEYTLTYERVKAE